jgi:hypothetical protein
LKEPREIQRSETQINLALSSGSSSGDATEIPMKRTEVRDYLTKIDSFIHGTDGIALAQEHGIPLADTLVIHRVAEWMQNAQDSERLWIECAWEQEENSSAREAALGVISIAAQAEAPFISYICCQPGDGEIHESLSPPRAGLLSTVYCLVLQLLRFQPTEDGFEVEKSKLDKLNGDADSWKPALEVLDDLLVHTPHVRYVIVDGLEQLEIGDGESCCLELLRLLLRHTQDLESPTSFLFTTSGSSETLFMVLESYERELTESSSRMVKRRGEELDFVL